MTCGNNFLWLQVLSAAVSEVCFDHYWKQTRALNITKNPWANPSSWLIIEHWEEATINNPWKKAKINRTADGQLLLRCWELNAVSVQKHCKRWELQRSETFIIRAETYSQNCRRAAVLLRSSSVLQQTHTRTCSKSLWQNFFIIPFRILNILHT